MAVMAAMVAVAAMAAVPAAVAVLHLLSARNANQARISYSNWWKQRLVKNMSEKEWPPMGFPK